MHGTTFRPCACPLNDIDPHAVISLVFSGAPLTPDRLADGGAFVTDRIPLFSKPLHVGCPNLGDRDRLLACFNDILERRWLTNDGTYVRQFEERVAEYLGVKHCLAVCNATVGLQLTIRALGLKGEVIVPAFTFPATVHALAWQGIRPVFCDVDLVTHNIDPVAIEQLITPDTSAILGVHLWGNSCAIDSLEAIAARHKLALIFDAAHAFGSSYHKRMIGNFGNAEVFSFHATKFLSTGEGGAITTNDDGLASELRQLRNFGIENGNVVGLGINGKMDEFSAATGLTALESCDGFIARNHMNLGAYEGALADLPGLRVCADTAHDRRNRQYIVVAVDEAEARLSRDEIVAALHSENVLAKRYFWPGCHRMEPYCSSDTAGGVSLPNTDRLCHELMQLPTGTSVSQADIARIGDFLGRLTCRARSAA
jgi:dTDP-4-amino-4,6-dideoxygalactose transaminase